MKGQKLFNKTDEEVEGLASKADAKVEMVRRMVLAVVMFSVLLVSGLGLATGPSFSGLTGLIAMPSAEIAIPGELNLGLHKVGDADWFDCGWAFSENSEISIWNQSGEDSNKYTMVNAKIAVAEVRRVAPAVALGVMDVTDELGSTFYLVATRRIGAAEGLPIKGNVGIGDGEVLDGLFGGVEFAMTEKDSFIVEHVNDHLNIGFKLGAPKGALKLDIATVQDEVGVGISYSLVF